MTSQIAAFDVERTHSSLRLESRLYRTYTVNQSINKGNNGSWDAYLASPICSAGLGADYIINNLAKGRESGIEIIKLTPYF